MVKRTIVSMPLTPRSMIARQAAGAPLQVVAERQLVHVDEGLVGELADRVLADLGEQRVAEVVEDVHQDAADAVGDDQHDRHGDERARGRRSSVPSAPAPAA